MIRLFKTGKREETTIWLVNPNPVCAVCGEEINVFSGVVIVDFHKRGVSYNLLHENCIKRFKKHPLSVTQYRWNVLITDSVPPSGIPIFVQNPSFKDARNGGVSVFEPELLPSDRVIDRAWRSKVYPSLEGASVGVGVFDGGEVGVIGLLEAEKEKKLLRGVNK